MFDSPRTGTCWIERFAASTLSVRIDGSTPGGGDTAFFNLAGAYTVSFNGTPVPIQALSVSDGTNATFTSTSIFDVSTLQVTSAGDSEVLVTHGAQRRCNGLVQLAAIGHLDRQCIACGGGNRQQTPAGDQYVAFSLG